MSEDEKAKLPAKIGNPIPVPYPVIGLAWVVALIASNRFLHEINWVLWVAGPALALAKVYMDAEVIGKKKDNPDPKEYNFHAPGVWAQLEQTIKTLPGYFKNVNVQILHQVLHPPKGMPMQMTARITLNHPDIPKDQVPQAKQNDMKSTITMTATVAPAGNKTVLKMAFVTDPLLGRKPLDDIINHICQHVDFLVSQHVKQ